MKITTKQITTTAVLLAICIVSQFFKNTSVYITGPVINACLILAVLSVGIPCGIILSVITPVTSFFITGSPIIGAIPASMPCIMAGNGPSGPGCGTGHEKMQRKRRTDCRHGGRICRKGTVHGNCDLADSDSEPSAGTDGGKDGSVPDDLFRDAACDFPDRKCVCIYSLDSVEKSGKIGKRDSDGGAGEKILLRFFAAFFIPYGYGKMTNI